jgi:hypothetical protein
MSGYLAERTRAVRIVRAARLKAEAALDESFILGDSTGALVHAHCVVMATEIEIEIAGVTAHG